MRTTKDKIIKITDTILCDKCGKDIPFNGLQIDYTFGYGTDWDGKDISLDFCEDCLIDIYKETLDGRVE